MKMKINHKNFKSKNVSQHNQQHKQQHKQQSLNKIKIKFHLSKIRTNLNNNLL